MRKVKRAHYVQRAPTAKTVVQLSCGWFMVWSEKERGFDEKIVFVACGSLERKSIYSVVLKRESGAADGWSPKCGVATDFQEWPVVQDE